MIIKITKIGDIIMSKTKPKNINSLVRGDSIEIEGKSIKGQYIVHKLMSDAGVYSNVYLAKDQNNEKFIIKILREGDDFKKYKEIFYAEAKLVEKLDHENIRNNVKQCSANISRNSNIISKKRSCLLMDYIDAKPMTHQADTKKVLDIFKQLVSALNKAHQNQIYHCDISPENVLIDDKNHITLIDFGFSASLEKSNTEKIPLIHTSQFRPPDNILNATSDVYSSGLLLYFMLTGKESNKNKILTTNISGKIYFNENYKPSDLNSSCNAKMDNIILKAISDSPSDRYTNMDQFLEAINEVMTPDEYEPSEEDKQLRDQFSMKMYTNQGDPHTYFFWVEDGDLVKLGDGQYGVVYQIWNKDNKFKAVKLLYEHQLPYKITEWKLSETCINAFLNTFNYLDCKVNRDRMEKLMPPIAELGEFLKKLLGQKFLEDKLERKLNEDELLFLLTHTQKTAQSVALKRFQYEKKSSAEIQNKYKDQKDEITGVISIEGGTDKFHKSNAYLNVEFIKNIQKQNPQMKLSNYALVMPYYKWTLKDLLENRYIRVNDELKEDTSGVTGYELLKKMNFDQRLLTIYPFIKDIVDGIKALHSADMFHHDIKPANIFVTTNRSQELISVVGDLGFLKTDNEIIEALSSKTIFGWPLGTKHYRSPEQKDNIDIHDIKIINDGVVKLIIQDPKFKDSIMDEEDLISFSNDSSYTFYEIAKVENKESPPYLLIKDPGNKLSKIAHNLKTHIVMHKKQSYRTDYFGIGAIIFDMLTCGKSPERFYDNIRIYDVKDDENADVLKIKEKYRQISKYELDQPGIVDMFNCFKHETDTQYAPVEIVEIILKCMLFNAKNTYYQKESNAEALDKISNDLFSLYNVNINNITKIEKIEKINPLISRKISDMNRSIESSNMVVVLKNLINRPFSALPSRLTNGVCYMKLLSRLAQEKTNFYFYELLPEIIDSSSEELVILYPTYKTKDDYLKDLINDNLYTRIRQSSQNSFIPFDIANIRREIFLRPKNDEKFEYYFDKKHGSVSDGDWIIINSELYSINFQKDEHHLIKLKPYPGSTSKNFQIDYQLSAEAIFNIKSELNESNQEIFDEKYKVLKDRFKNTNKERSENKKYSQEEFEKLLISLELNEEIAQTIKLYSVMDIKGVFYRQLKPCNYYLKMLASYLYTIFFVKNNHLSVDQPIKDIYENKSQIEKDVFPLVNENTKIKILHRRKDSSIDDDLIDIYKWVTYIYIRLHFTEDPNSYYNCDENFNEYDSKNEEDKNFKNSRLTSVIEDINVLIANIAGMIHERKSDLEKLISTDKAIDINKQNRFTSKDIEKDIDFTSLFQDIVEMNTKISDETQQQGNLNIKRKKARRQRAKNILKSMKDQCKEFLR